MGNEKRFGSGVRELGKFPKAQAHPPGLGCFSLLVSSFGWLFFTGKEDSVLSPGPRLAICAPLEALNGLVALATEVVSDQIRV